VKLVVINPPSEFLIDDRAFLSLGPLQIATAARDVAGWEVEVLDLTGHLRRCAPDAPARVSGVQGTSGVNASGETGNRGGSSPMGHASDECEMEVWQHCATEIAAAAARGGVDAWGFYSMSCHLATNKRLLGLVREVSPDTPTIIGGPHASLDPADCMRVGFDYVVAAQTGGGGGERPMMALLKAIEQREVAIPRVWRTTDAKGRGPKGDQDAWPHADRTLVDHADYHYMLDGERAASMVTQYGCPYVCTFCSHGPGYTAIRYRGADLVEAELDDLWGLGYRAVMLYDDEVNIHKAHFAMLCNLLAARGMKWRAFIKANLFTEEQAALAAASGCVALCTGAEAADDYTLKAIKKASKRADNSRFVKLCVKHGIKPKVFTMVGLPTQDEAACLQLRDWLLEMVAEGLRDYDVTIYTPYPGTPYFDRPEEFGISFRHGRLDYAERIVNYKGKPGEYEGHVDTAHLTAEQIVALREVVDRAVRVVVEQHRAAEGSTLVGGDRYLQQTYDAVAIDGG
jgi:radical SAM superfamily enzyme YgiQ (UPF0313 family)